MSRRVFDQQNYASLEENLVTKIETSVFTMTITDINQAFKFLKQELVSLVEKYPNTFFYKNTGNDGLLFGFLAENVRHKAYGGDERNIYINFYREGTNKRFEIKVGNLSNIYKFERLETGYGHKLVEESNGEDYFGLVEVPVNKLLVTTLLEKLSGPIDSLIFGAAK